MPLVLAAFTAWLFVPVPALTATVPAPQRSAALSGLPWLSAHPQQIVDSSGRTVILRGFNDDALLEATQHPAPLDATDATLMDRSGFDVVRLPIAWSLLEPQRGSFDMAYLQRIEDAVDLLTADGLYVVIDMHFLGYSPVYGGSGAPAWATVANIPDPVWGPMPSLGRFLSPAIEISTAHFWLSQSLQDEFLRAWAVVAQRFRDDSGVAGYDLVNEPHSFPLPPFRFDKDQLFPFYAHAIQTLGAVDPNHLFFLDNDMAGDLPTSVVPLSAPNLVYAPHVYTGSLIPPPFDGSTEPLQTHVNELASEAAAVPAALWFGEFDIDFHNPLAARWIDSVLSDFAAHGAGWAWWQWRESSGYGIRSADGSTIDTALLRALALPYVEAAPRGVSVTRAGPGTLDLRVLPAHDASPTEVSWPEYLVGRPSLTSDCGAVGQWDPNLNRLQVLTPLSGACTLHISG